MANINIQLDLNQRIDKIAAQCAELNGPATEAKNILFDAERRFVFGSVRVHARVLIYAECERLKLEYRSQRGIFINDKPIEAACEYEHLVAVRHLPALIERIELQVENDFRKLEAFTNALAEY